MTDNSASVQILPVDIWKAILSMCDICTVLKVGEVDRYFNRLVFSQSIWLHFLSCLQAKNLVDLFPGEILSELPVKQLVGLAMCVVQGPPRRPFPVEQQGLTHPQEESWTESALDVNPSVVNTGHEEMLEGCTRFKQSSLTIPTRKVVLDRPIEGTDHPLRYSARLVPGGQYLLFLDGCLLECWCLVRKEVIWTYLIDLESAIAKFAFDVVDGGRAMVIFCVAMNLEHSVAVVLRLDLQRRTSETLRKERFSPDFLDFCSVHGDFAVAAGYHSVIIICISDERIGVFDCPEHIVALDLTPLHLTIVNYLDGSKLGVHLFSLKTVVSVLRAGNPNLDPEFISTVDLKLSVHVETLLDNLYPCTCSIYPSPIDKDITRIWLTFQFPSEDAQCPLICIFRLDANLQTNQSIQLYPVAYVLNFEMIEGIYKPIWAYGSKPYISYAGNLLTPMGGFNVISWRTLESFKHVSEYPSPPRVYSHMSRGSQAVTSFSLENIVVEYFQISGKSISIGPVDAEDGL